jgi:HSP20 family protein
MAKDSEKQAKFSARGGLGLGGIFKGLGDFIELLGDLAEKGEELRREGEIKIGEEVKGVYGFTIRTGIGGEPRVSSFGNIKKTPQGPVVEKEREPIVDVFDEKDHVLVLAELPGVAEENIASEVKGDILTIKASNSDRQYRKEVILPSEVDSGTLTTSYKNGILEIKLKKTSK